MSVMFPDVSDLAPSNVIVGDNFDIMKRSPIHEAFVGYGQVKISTKIFEILMHFIRQNVFKFKSNDRMVPTRRETTSDFLQKTQVNLFDVAKPDNNLKTMKKVHYQNHIRKLFLLNQKIKCDEKQKEEKEQEIKLLHEDWACKIQENRLKFMPDFETMKKPGFGHIS
jgi:hypothetical protein